MKTLTIITSRSITHNRFLLEISNSLSKNFKVTLCCRDTKNINDLNNLNKENIPFPNSLIDLFDINKTYQMVVKIIKVINQSDLIYLHTPLASHFVRLVYIFLFKKLKVIYHVHGLRYIPGEWNFGGLIYRFLEFIFSFKTDKFITINNMDYKSMRKFIPHKKIYLVKGVGVNLKSSFKIKINKNRNQKFIVGVIAAFNKSKGYKELIKIAKNCQINSFRPGIASQKTRFLKTFLIFAKGEIPVYENRPLRKILVTSRMCCNLQYMRASQSTKCCNLQHFLAFEIRKSCLPLGLF